MQGHGAHQAQGHRRRVDIKGDELDWDAVGGDERQMGTEIHYEAVLDHPELGELTWGLWEYPIGIENYSDTDVGRHEVVQDIDYGLKHGEPEWLDYDVPPNPYTIFMDSFHQLPGLLAVHGKDDGRGADCGI